MKAVNRIFKVLSWIVIVVIIAYVAIAAPIVTGHRPVVVLSGSMTPTYPVGSVIYYHGCNFEELTVGDAITFRAGDSLVTHRITTVNRDSGTVVTKGDNNETEDPNPVEANEIVGKATGFAIPYAGYFVTYGKKPVAIIVMAAILLINYVLEKLFPGQKGEKKREKKKE